MKAVILAAGYGTRLQRDVEHDGTGRFQHLSGVAKPLLPVGRRALISHWVSALTLSGCVDGIYVVVSCYQFHIFICKDGISQLNMFIHVILSLCQT